MTNTSSTGNFDSCKKLAKLMQKGRILERWDMRKSTEHAELRGNVEFGSTGNGRTLEEGVALVVYLHVLFYSRCPSTTCALSTSLWLIVRFGPWNQYRPPSPNGMIQPTIVKIVTPPIMTGA